MDGNNDRENSFQVDNNYQIGDKVLDTDSDIVRKLNYPTKEHYISIQIYTNDMVWCSSCMGSN